MREWVGSTRKIPYPPCDAMHDGRPMSRRPPSPSLFFVPAAHRSSHLPRSAAMILVMIDTGKAHPLICSRTSPISCLAASVDPDRTLCPPPHLYLLSLSSALDSYLSHCHPYLSAIGASQPSDVCRTSPRCEFARSLTNHQLCHQPVSLSTLICLPCVPGSRGSPCASRHTVTVNEPYMYMHPRCTNFDRGPISAERTAAGNNCLKKKKKKTDGKSGPGRLRFPLIVADVAANQRGRPPSFRPGTADLIRTV